MNITTKLVTLKDLRKQRAFRFISGFVMLLLSLLGWQIPVFLNPSTFFVVLPIVTFISIIGVYMYTSWVFEVDERIHRILQEEEDNVY